MSNPFASMYLIYFDEVKDDGNAQKFFWVGGIAVHTDYVKTVEDKVAVISQAHFDTPCLGRETEFHAAEIYHRKKLFKDWIDPRNRVQLIGSLLRILDDDNIRKLYVKISREYFTQKFTAKKIDEMAFMMFCEKANVLMRQLSDIGMLIGDRESDSLATKYAESLSNWRNHRTEYHMGTEIRHLIDTVHFTHSHLSRLLQLADVHLWCRQFADVQRNTESATAKLMLAEIGGAGRALFASRYKEYPLGC